MAVSISGQTLELYSNNYLNVINYEGAVSSDSHRFVFIYSGTNMNVPNWKLSMRVTGPILSSDGKEFPSHKISFVPVRTYGQSQPDPIPTLSQIGVPSSIPLNGTQEMFLVPSSNAPLKNISQWNSYYSMSIVFSFVVAGGTYLEDLKDGLNEYAVPLEFTASRGDGSIIGTISRNYTIKVHENLTGTPPPDDKVFSIQVSPAASNALLEFKTVSDYIGGKSETYENGLSVTSNTKYEVWVHSTSGNFLSNTGKTLPLDVVNLQLDGIGGTMWPITLSTGSKKILEGESTGGVAQYFDITYFTKKDDSRLFAVPPDNYATSLMYEITPK